jgi:putative oxidoreductase
MNSAIVARAGAFYDLVSRGASSLQSPLLLAMRLYWGWGFFMAGKGKLMNIERTAGFFEKLGIPAPTLSAWLAASTECFGGLLLFAGLASRLVSIPLAFTMVVAYATAHAEAVRTVFRDPDKFMGEPPFLFLLASLVVLAFGPGAFSLDWVIGRVARPPKSDPARHG